MYTAVGDTATLVGVIGCPTVTVAVPETVVPTAVALIIIWVPGAAVGMSKPLTIVPEFAGSIRHVTSWDAPAGLTAAVNCCCPRCGTVMVFGVTLTLGDPLPVGEEQLVIENAIIAAMAITPESLNILFMLKTPFVGY
jgi:hypothetical protein